MSKEAIDSRPNILPPNHSRKDFDFINTTETTVVIRSTACVTAPGGAKSESSMVWCRRHGWEVEENG